MTRTQHASPTTEAKQGGAGCDYSARAIAIVDRVMPRMATANGTDPVRFIEVSRHDYQRSLLFWRTFARLRAKAEGGAPYISMPKGCSAVLGGAMEQVSRELAALPSLVERRAA